MTHISSPEMTYLKEDGDDAGGILTHISSPEMTLSSDCNGQVADYFDSHLLTGDDGYSDFPVYVGKGILTHISSPEMTIFHPMIRDIRKDFDSHLLTGDDNVKSEIKLF